MRKDQSREPEAIAPGYDFPRSEAELTEWLDQGRESRLRWHAWRVLEGLTAPAINSALPRWRTWYSNDQVFKNSVSPHLLAQQLEVPVQLLDTIQAQMNSIKNASAPSVPEKIVPTRHILFVSTVLFDPVSVAAIRTPLPGNPTIRLWCRKDLDLLNEAFNANQTPLAFRLIPEFPNAAIAVKALWAVIPDKGGPSQLGVWDPPPANLILPNGNDMTTFRRTVKVDPSQKSCSGPGTVCLDRFYHYSLSSKDADVVNGLPIVAIGQMAKEGDHLILLGLHLTTKEIKNWVWATFWWHDQPHVGPYAADRPGSLPSPWNNYLMDVSYDMDRPQAAPGVPHICFNPYLEANLPKGAGTSSNCMTCHRRAAVGLDDSKNDIYRGIIEPFDPMFKGTTKTDFLWSLVTNSPADCH